MRGYPLPPQHTKRLRTPKQHVLKELTCVFDYGGHVYEVNLVMISTDHAVRTVG